MDSSSSLPLSPLSSLPPDIAAILHYVDAPLASPLQLQHIQHNAGPSGEPHKEMLADDSIYDSEEEVEGQLSLSAAGRNLDDERLSSQPTKKEDAPMATEPSSDSESSLASSDESDNDAQPQRRRPFTAQSGADQEDDDGSDEEGIPNGIIASKNEIVKPQVNMPSILSVDDDEVIEEMGEIMSIIDSVVVIRGSAGSLREKVLDTGSLLVFDDRKVLGEIFETFGPTHQPLYSILFPSASSIDSQAVTIARKVFHVPSRSFFVFTRALRMQKGSDASNVHDEEVAEWELDFSDDEKEVQHKRSLKNRRHPQQPEVAEPAARTPGPSSSVPSLPVYRDDGDIPYESSPYDPYIPSAVSLSTVEVSGPVPDPHLGGRSKPAPYDDLEPLERETKDDVSHTPSVSSDPSSRGWGKPARARMRNRGRGVGRGGNRQGRGNNFNNRSGNRHHHQHTPQQTQDSYGQSAEEYDYWSLHSGYSPSPFTQANDNWSNNLSWGSQGVEAQYGSYNSSWNVPGYGISLGSNGVAPHINPRFYGQYASGNPYLTTQPQWDTASGNFSSNQFNSLPNANYPDLDFTDNKLNGDMPASHKRNQSM
ncbi:hypothetical protein FRC02_001949 [Tulasnella sp. 418]|nr:hypothetical protein FRC02_001949 [Tulasnella sp. 418]